MTRGLKKKAKSGARPVSGKFTLNDITHFVGAARFGNWRREFDRAQLRDYHFFRQHQVAQFDRLSKAGITWRRNVQPRVLHAIFSTDRADHSFTERPLDWGFGLTEPMATRALAKFLSYGSAELRARRISAFLQAIGFSEGSVSLDALQRCQVVAEEDRIDMKLVWKDEHGRDAVIIIEAKFGHKVTEGQLSSYRATVKRVHRCAPIASVLLTLDENVCASLKGKQRKLWTQVDWRDFWLRFERHRPVEQNPSLQMFLNTLWHRTGCLTQENRYGHL